MIILKSVYKELKTARILHALNVNGGGFGVFC